MLVYHAPHSILVYHAPHSIQFISIHLINTCFYSYGRIAMDVLVNKGYQVSIVVFLNHPYIVESTDLLSPLPMRTGTRSTVNARTMYKVEYHRPLPSVLLSSQDQKSGRNFYE